MPMLVDEEIRVDGWRGKKSVHIQYHHSSMGGTCGQWLSYDGVTHRILVDSCCSRYLLLDPGMRKYALNEWRHIVNVACVVICSKTHFFFKCDFGCTSLTSFDVFVDHAPYESR